MLLLSRWPSWKRSHWSLAHSIPLLEFERIILIFLIICSYFHYLSYFLTSPAFLLHSCFLFKILIFLSIGNFVQTCILYDMILDIINGFILWEYFYSFYIFIAHDMWLLNRIMMLAGNYIVNLEFIHVLLFIYIIFR